MLSCREETKGWFCKRVVLASVPSFRFLGSRNIKCHSLFCQSRTAGKDFWRKFRYRGTSAKTTVLETTLSEPPKLVQFPRTKSVVLGVFLCLGRVSTCPKLLSAQNVFPPSSGLKEAAMWAFCEAFQMLWSHVCCKLNMKMWARIYGLQS